MSMPKKAMILAAGRGTRLKPYTDTMPKPMVPVAGTPMLGHSLDKLAKIGIEDVVINLHHHGAVIEDYIKERMAKGLGPKVTLSWEGALLETGGGMKAALPHLGNEPFFAINGDALWQDGDTQSLQDLAEAWDPSVMDVLLLLQPLEAMQRGDGDYTLHPDGRCARRPNKDGTHMFAGIRITKTEIIAAVEEEHFSYLKVMDQAEARGRLYGLPNKGAWYHISTPEDLAHADKVYKP